MGTRFLKTKDENGYDIYTLIKEPAPFGCTWFGLDTGHGVKYYLRAVTFEDGDKPPPGYSWRFSPNTGKHELTPNYQDFNS